LDDGVLLGVLIGGGQGEPAGDGLYMSAAIIRHAREMRPMPRPRFSLWRGGARTVLTPPLQQPPAQSAIGFDAHACPMYNPLFPGFQTVQRSSAAHLRQGFF
jgi:hypothetical protein